MPGILITILSAACIVSVFFALKKGLAKAGFDKQKQNRIFAITVVAVVCWVVLLAILSLNGFFQNFTSFPPRPALVLLIPLPVILIIAFSKTTAKILKAIPLHWLVMAQAFRILVELVLFAGYFKKLIPVQMTFEGLNFDIVTGVLALPVGYFCFIKKSWPPSITVAFNIAGMLLLLNILVIAVLSMPTSFRFFMNEPANTIIAAFPFIYLPGVLVVMAYSLHIFSLRQLYLLRNTDTIRKS